MLAVDMIAASTASARTTDNAGTVISGIIIAVAMVVAVPGTGCETEGNIKEYENARELVHDAPLEFKDCGYVDLDSEFEEEHKASENYDECSYDPYKVALECFDENTDKCKRAYLEVLRPSEGTVRVHYYAVYPSGDRCNLLISYEESTLSVAKFKSYICDYPSISRPNCNKDDSLQYCDTIEYFRCDSERCEDLEDTGEPF